MVGAIEEAGHRSVARAWLVNGVVVARRGLDVFARHAVGGIAATDDRV